ncbi:hypothetical protein SD80_014020 [Scytonema tolypothrichoides VB-61278]|nr:hypothetical protein SD80_014020 [Scytonema tolypothrichoides VB-61278]
MKKLNLAGTFLLAVTVVSIQAFANQTLATVKLKQHLDDPYSNMMTRHSPSTDQQITTRLNPSTAKTYQANSVIAKFQTYVENKLYSISYPLEWFITRSHRELAYITNHKMTTTGEGGFPADFIKTDVQIISENFQTSFTQHLTFSKEDGERLVKKENIKIDGKNAVRLWYSGGETETVMTLLPYKDNNTVCIATFYTTNYSNYIPIIEKMHSSFKVLD